MCQESLPSELFKLTPTEVHVWRASLSVGAAAVRSFRQILSDEELARADRLAFERDRARLITTHGILRALLGRYMDASPPSLVFAVGTHGKPYLVGRERTIGPLRFNVSHSHDMALFAVARDREVGIDVEHIRDDVETLKLAERFFTAGEVEALRSLSTDRAHREFFAYWTCKEAYLKGLGSGLTLALDQFEIVLATDDCGASVRGLHEGAGESNWAIRRISLGADYAAAIAVHGKDWRMTCGRWPDALA